MRPLSISCVSRVFLGTETRRDCPFMFPSSHLRGPYTSIDLLMYVGEIGCILTSIKVYLVGSPTPIPPICFITMRILFV